jgi:hypothetical protein
LPLNARQYFSNPYSTVGRLWWDTKNIFLFARRRRDDTAIAKASRPGSNTALFFLIGKKIHDEPYFLGK